MLVWLPRQPIDHVAIPVLGIVLGLILLVDIPLCVLILVGYPATMTLSPLVSSAAERAKWREMRQRPQLSDDEFLERYYAATSIPRDIPLHLRSVYSEQLGIDKVQPDDIATDFDGNSISGIWPSKCNMNLAFNLQWRRFSSLRIVRFLRPGSGSKTRRAGEQSRGHRNDK